MEDKQVNNGYALVTGATSGFGFEISKLLAKSGLNLVLVARSNERLQEISEQFQKEYFVNVVSIAADLFDPAAAKHIYETTTAKGLRVEVLVNDAGQGQHGNFVEYDIARDIDLIQLNITSLVCLTKFYLKDMLAQNSGRILNVASLLGKYPTPLMSVYAATKAFVITFTEGLIHEVKDSNVTLTALLPGASDTDFFHKSGAEETATYREENLSDPAEVAKDGFDAMMKGESRIVSGAKNKAYAAMSNVLPDSTLASTMAQKMGPSSKADGREHITHGPSIEERDQIDRTTGKGDGDYEEHEDHVHNK